MIFVVGIVVFVGQMGSAVGGALPERFEPPRDNFLWVAMDASFSEDSECLPISCCDEAFMSIIIFNPIAGLLLHTLLENVGGIVAVASLRMFLLR